MADARAAPARPTGRRAPSLAIVGGGISGLALAHYARRAAEAAGRPLDVVVLEQAERPGGKLVTAREGGYVVEGGPDAFLTTKPWAVELCHELGIGDALIGTDPQRRRVYVLSGGRLQPMPDGFRLIAPTRLWPFLTTPLLSWRGKLRAALELALPARRGEGDESLGAFVRRRFGREVLDRFGAPLLAGIHVGDPERLSLRATFPRLAELERRHGSVTRGMLRERGRAARAPTVGETGGPAGLAHRPAFVAPAGGAATLIEALAARLGDAVRTGQAVRRLSRADGAWRLDVAGGPAVRADTVALAVPGPVAGRLVAEVAPGAAAEIGAIRHLSSATVSLAFDAHDLARPLDGYGFVVASGEPVRIRGCTWTSTKFAGRAPAGRALVRAFVGGAGREDDVDLPDDALVALVRRDLSRIMGLEAPPRRAWVFRWPAGNPQYDVGHLARVGRIEAALPDGVVVLGASFGGGGVPDCVRIAREVAARCVDGRA